MTLIDAISQALEQLPDYFILTGYGCPMCGGTLFKGSPEYRECDACGWVGFNNGEAYFDTHLGEVYHDQQT